MCCHRCYRLRSPNTIATGPERIEGESSMANPMRWWGGILVLAALAACGSESVVGGDADAPDVGPLDSGPADTGPGACRDNTDCAANEFGFRVCDLPSGACVACTAASHAACATGQYCTAAHRCEAGCVDD